MSDEQPATQAKGPAPVTIGNASADTSGLTPAARQFANSYAALTDVDIDSLLADIDSPGGKEAFREVMDGFRES